MARLYSAELEGVEYARAALEARTDAAHHRRISSPFDRAAMPHPAIDGGAEAGTHGEAAESGTRQEFQITDPAISIPRGFTSGGFRWGRRSPGRAFPNRARLARRMRISGYRRQAQLAARGNARAGPGSDGRRRRHVHKLDRRRKAPRRLSPGSPPGDKSSETATIGCPQSGEPQTRSLVGHAIGGAGKWHRDELRCGAQPRHGASGSTSRAATRGAAARSCPCSRSERATRNGLKRAARCEPMLSAYSHRAPIVFELDSCAPVTVLSSKKLEKPPIGNTGFTYPTEGNSRNPSLQPLAASRSKWISAQQVLVPLIRKEDRRGVEGS